VRIEQVRKLERSMLMVGSSGCSDLKRRAQAAPPWGVCARAARPDPRAQSAPSTFQLLPMLDGHR
jgi:hypothetical protein